MQASVVDLYLHGNLRIVFKPLLQRLPLVGGMQVIPNIDVLNQILDSLFYYLLRVVFSTILNLFLADVFSAQSNP